MLPDHEENGLPKRLHLSLVEAVSWLALRRAVPHEVWAPALLLDDAIECQTLRVPSVNAMPYAGGQTWVSNEYDEKLGEAQRPNIRNIFHADIETAQKAGAGSERAVQVLRDAWAARLATVSDGKKPDDDSHFQEVLRKVHTARIALFERLGSGELVCAGCPPGSLQWEPMPADFFQQRVTVALGSNMLVPTDLDGSEAELIIDLVSSWRGARIETRALADVTPLAADAGNAESRAGLSGADVGDGAEHEAGSADTRRSGSQTGKASQAEHDEWMKARVRKLLAAGLQSNTPEDEKAAKAEPPEGLGVRSDRKRVREARRAHAPSNWQKTDVRRQK